MRQFLDRSRIPSYPHRHPKISELGYGVTVCVAALCHLGDTIVTAEDHMATYTGETVEGSLLKSTQLAKNWWVMMAGDINRCEVIVNKAQRDIKDQWLTLEEI